MNRFKNILIVILCLLLVAVTGFGLKTWNDEGKALSQQNEKKTAEAYKSAPEIKVTSDNLFTPEHVTASPITISFIATGIKDTYINGQSLEKATEALIDKAGVYELIIESEDGQKAILRLTIDPGVKVDQATAVKGDDLQSEPYTGEIKPPVTGPQVQAVSPENLTNGGSVSAEEVVIAYSSPDGIAAVVLDDEEMEITGSVTSYRPGEHTLVVTDQKGQTTVFTFTNTYGEE